MIESTDNADDLIRAYIAKSASVKLSGADEDFDAFKKPISQIRKMSGLDKNFVRRMDRKLSKAYENQAQTAGTKALNVDDLQGYNYLECITPEYNLDYLAKLYEISPAHHAAVNAKVESVFGLGYEWIESNKTKLARQKTTTPAGLKKLEKALENARVSMEDWLESTNREDIFDEIMKKIGRDYETMGNAYMEIGRDIQGRIAYIGHVPAIHVRVRRQRDGFIQVYGANVAYFRNFGDKGPNRVTDDENPNELIHFKKYSPNDNYYGIPDIVAAKHALAGNEFASRYNLDYFENKAIPRHVIITKGASLTATAMATLVEFFETGLRGQHHRSVYVPLGDINAEIEFKSIEPGKQDSSFGDFRNSNNEEIFMAHRTPPSRAGVFSENVGLAAAKDADKVFKESYSRPEQSAFEKKIKRVFKEITDIIELKLNELSLTDANTQSQMDEREVKMGIVVPDEVRARKGMAARPDGKGSEPITLTAQQQADQKANTLKTRERDTQRSNNASDSAGSASGRNVKGTGRASK